MAKDYDYPSYDAGGRVEAKKFPSGHNPGYQEYFDKQSFGTAFSLAKSAGAKEFTWRDRKYNTKTKDETKKK